MKIRYILIRVLPFLGIFIIAWLVTSIVINRGDGLDSYDTSEPTFPVMYMEKENERFNIIRGYKGEMDETQLRNWVYPMNSDGLIPFDLEKYGNNIKSVKYQAMEYVGRKVIAEGTVNDLKDDGKFVSGVIDVSTRIKDNKEYYLKLIVDTAKEEISYCTRIMFPGEREYLEALSFAKDFHRNTFNKSANEAISNYLEIRTDVNNNVFNKVNIGSSYDNITWGSMKVSEYTEPVYNFSEINSSFTGMRADYVLKVDDPDSTDLYTLYNIREYYRIRKTDGKMYILDFNRTMEQIYDINNIMVSEGALLLGIADPENDCKTSELGAVVAFVSNGELFSFNSGTGVMRKLFGYIGKDVRDERANNDDHDIRIIKVSESGNITFAVVGYFNGGEHEGETGISVYNYNAQSKEIKEDVYIKVSMPFRVLKGIVGGVLYLNDHNDLYISYAEELYRINLGDKSIKSVAKELSKDIYSVSDDGHLIAISNNKSKYDITEITVMNLDTGKTYVISAPEGSKIYPAGFLGTDIVYGTAYDSDIITDSVGNRLFLMHKMTIADDKGDAKEYEQSEYLISRAYIEGTKIMLKRVTKDSNHSPASDDSIVNLKENNRIGNKVAMVSTRDRKQQRGYVFAEGSPHAAHPETDDKYYKNKDNTVDNGMSFDKESVFYAYAAGEINCISPRTEEVIAAGDAASGVVLDGKGAYLWIKGQKSRQKELAGYDVTSSGGSSYEACLKEMLAHMGINTDVKSMLDSGMSPVEILEKTLNVQVVNLSGCGLDCALNFISEGAPVFAVNDKGQAVLIVAYDIYNITVASPSEGNAKKISLSDSRTMFSEAGNLFLTYKR
ncbi:MAG: hypothetical protein IK152_02450 [Lachnospiraceae bacterium]|nr:hypothetical protein [Lachnospiraceae bacterium]